MDHRTKTIITAIPSLYEILTSGGYTTDDQDKKVEVWMCSAAAVAAIDDLAHGGLGIALSATLTAKQFRCICIAEVSDPEYSTRGAVHVTKDGVVVKSEDAMHMGFSDIFVSGDWCAIMDFERGTDRLILRVWSGDKLGLSIGE